MKIERFNFQPLMTERDRWAELVSNSEGSFCLYHQVVELEAKCSELEAKCAELETKGAELLEALKEIMWQTEGNNKSIIAEARAYSIARAAIAKAKGDQP